MLAWMVIAQIHLLVNSAQSVLGCTIKTDEQASRSEKWLKFSGNVEYAWQLSKNASGRRAAEDFMETTEEHKVLRPIERAKIHKCHTVTEKSPSHGKKWSYRASWRGGHVPKFSMCQQRKGRTSKSTKKLNENWDAISLVVLRALLRENFSSFRCTLHNFKPVLCF